MAARSGVRRRSAARRRPAPQRSRSDASVQRTRPMIRRQHDDDDGTDRHHQTDSPSGPSRSQSPESPRPHHSIPSRAANTSSSASPSSRPEVVSWMMDVFHPDSRHPWAHVWKLVVSWVITMDVALFIVATSLVTKENESMDGWPTPPRAWVTVVARLERACSTLLLGDTLARTLTLVMRPEHHHHPLAGSRSSPPRSRGVRGVARCGRHLPRWFTLRLGWEGIMIVIPALPIRLEAFLPPSVAPRGHRPTMTAGLRVLRLGRVCYTDRSALVLDTVYRVLYYNREILGVALHICAYLVLLTGVLLYYLRPPPSPAVEENHGVTSTAAAAGDDFHSIAATLYLSTLMLTGQGSPSGDLPWYTKGVVLLTSVVSVAMFAIPASMITWGFEAEAARIAKRAARQRRRERRPPPPVRASPSKLCHASPPGPTSRAGRSPDGRLSHPHRPAIHRTSRRSWLMKGILENRGHPNDERNASRLPHDDEEVEKSSGGSNSEGDTTDEEYLRIIADDDDESSTTSDHGGDRLLLQTRLLQRFDTLLARTDRNHNGAFFAGEFRQLPCTTSSRWSPDAHWLARLDALEESVRRQDGKLDRILELLATQSNHPGAHGTVKKFQSRDPVANDKIQQS